MQDINEFKQHRSALFGLAYRMLGSVMDAEDIVQEAFIRWQDASKSDIDCPEAYLTTIVTRLCIDHLRLAYVQREEYIGSWLPEPLLQTMDSDPARSVELNESISTAFLLLLESLSPLHRAVFLLHEVFNYTFVEIANIVDKTPADCRQIGHRARQRLMEGRPRFNVETEVLEETVQRFLDACVGEDLIGLLDVLAPDVTLTTDSGGKVQSIRNVLVGPDKVARFFLGIFRRWAPPLQTRVTTINGQTTLIMCAYGQPVTVASFEMRDDRIHAIYQMRNPDKLKSLSCDSTNDLEQPDR